MNFLPDIPLIKILQYEIFSQVEYQVSLFYVCKRWNLIISNFCYISIFESENADYDSRLRRLISDFKCKLVNWHMKFGKSLELETNLSEKEIYEYFCSRRISFMIFNKRNLFFIRIFDRWGRKCVSNCCGHMNCQGALPLASTNANHLKDTASFPYYFFYYYKCRFVQRLENCNTGNACRRELFCAAMEFVTDINDILQPHLVKTKHIRKLEKLLIDGINNGCHESAVAFNINIDLTILRLQMEANEADAIAENEYLEQLFNDL